MTASERRCELSDLPASMCAHCRGHDDAAVPAGELAAEDIGPLFAARYDGWCESCAGPIRTGDVIAALTDGPGYACPECLP